MAIHKHNQATAGVKAPDDVSEIAHNLGAQEVVFTPSKSYKNVNITRFFAFFVGLKNWWNLMSSIQKDSWVLLQHPNENILVANRFIDICKRRKGTKFIILIHDLESLRKSSGLEDGKCLEGRSYLADEVLLKKADFIICHNKTMKQYLVDRGFEEERLIPLQIFDYLHTSFLPEKRIRTKSVVVAGNLVRHKCEYLYRLIEKKDLDFNLNLFGPNFDGAIENANVKYYGQCSPDELPEKLEGAFGLVWDGIEVEGCRGNMGEYIKYNNPHKCSLFLASNMPVIIWREAALAEFIQSKGLGIVVDSLLDIGDIIEKISDEEYNEMLENVKRVGDKIRSGYYLSYALNAIFDHAIVKGDNI
ncbi:hypothetical protein [Faecalicatena faecalis]|nr:hypothetical protein [Faecalicatena faecalis]